MTTQQDSDRGPIAVILGPGEARIWGMTARERHQRLFARLGLPSTDATPSVGAAVIVRGDWIVDEALMIEVARRPGTVLQTDAGAPVAAHVADDALAAMKQLSAGAALPGLEVISPDDLVYNSAQLSLALVSPRRPNTSWLAR